MNFEVEILKHPTEEDWMLCKMCTLVTVGKKAIKPPDDEWKVKILKANHSPIRTLQFCFRITNIPYWVVGHLVRHVHAVPFVKTQRTDRNNGHDRGADRQDALVNMCWYMNAEELITISHKRLCGQASPETRQVIEKICDMVVEVNPEFNGRFEPMCFYRGGICDEFECCGLNEIYKGGVIHVD